MVMFGHWCGLFFWTNKQLGEHLGLPSISYYSDIYIRLLPEWLPSFNFGIFGVSIFFLISGFVIPFSVRKKTRLGFIISRAIRIFPTYIVCLASSLLCIFLANIALGSEFNFSLKSIIFNALLVHNLFDMPSIDWVNWTLAIEIKFYLVTLVLAFAILNFKVIPIFVYTLFVGLFAYGINTFFLGGGKFCNALAGDLLYTQYMFIGTIFYFNYSRKLSLFRSLVCICLLLLCFYYSWQYTFFSNIRGDFFPNYLYGVALFGVCYCFRDYFSKNRVLDFFANISYPGYAVHSMTGYASLLFLMNIGFSYWISLAITFLFVLVLSYLFHITVEVKTINLGKKIR